MGGKRSCARQHLRICLALLTLLSGCTFFKKDIPEPIVPAKLEEPVMMPKPIPQSKPDVSREPKEVPKEVRERREAQEYLQLSQNLLARGDYEGSLRESQKALALAKNQTPADEALFNMGLVYAHPKNPKKDNRRAISFFNRVAKGYPDSPLSEQAKIWVGVLDGMEQLKQVDIEIEEKKRDRTR